MHGLIERVRERPHAYVAQERLAFSQAPVWRNGAAQGFAARALGIRVYAMATPTGYRVMPGGLARIAGDGAVDIVSMQRGGGSKDVWVLTPDLRPIDEFNGSAPQPRTPVRHDELPSRMVENLYWLGRYSERCDSKARLLRASIARAQQRGAVARGHSAACRHFGCLRSPEEDAPPKPGEATLPMFSEANPLGLASDLQRLVWCASQVRSRLSAENWRAIGVLQREFHDAAVRGADPSRDPRSHAAVAWRRSQALPTTT